MKPRVVKWSCSRSSVIVNRFLERPAFSAIAEDVATHVLGEVRARGLDAVCEYAGKFDHVQLTPGTIRVRADEIDDALSRVDASFRRAAREAHRRIVRYARAGIKRDWQIDTAHGGTLGEVFRPFDRVGAYVPAGEAPLASTALMTVTLAQVAGVPEVVACVPPRSDGTVEPHVLYALQLAGATEVYRVGGVQAIGLMAFGARGIEPVQKIVGPGGAYVTAAKRQVYGHVALDLVAGPSEIAVLADDSADPACVAADLLSQAEHGTGHEKALLATPSHELAAVVAREVEEQSRTLSRRAAIERVIRHGMVLAVVPDIETGVELCNRFAAEHLELIVRNPRKWLRQVRAAGAVFLGPWTPEAAGDFVAGPSHVLPTGGAAARFSGLTVDDFLRRSSVVAYKRQDLEDALPVIRAFAAVEGLDGHGRSADLRFASKRGGAGRVGKRGRSRS